MSEEKLYMVKNDEGSYITVINGWLVHWHENSGDLFSSYQEASKLATTLGGHVVTLVEEPEKVVITKEQAEIVEGARISRYPASNISKPAYSSDDEKLLIQALVKGYTVGQVKKYLVYKALGGKQEHEHFAQAYRSPLFPDTITWFVEERKNPKTGASAQFTESEIEHYGLQERARNLRRRYRAHR